MSEREKLLEIIWDHPEVADYLDNLLLQIAGYSLSDLVALEEE